MPEIPPPIRGEDFEDGHRNLIFKGGVIRELQVWIHQCAHALSDGRGYSTDVYAPCVMEDGSRRWMPIILQHRHTDPNDFDWLRPQLEELDQTGLVNAIEGEDGFPVQDDQ